MLDYLDTAIENEFRQIIGGFGVALLVYFPWFNCNNFLSDFRVRCAYSK